jgi:hypothetical protein
MKFVAASLFFFVVSNGALANSGPTRTCIGRVSSAERNLKTQSDEKRKWENSLSKSSCFDLAHFSCRDKSKIKTPEAAAKCNARPKAEKCEKMRADFDARISLAQKELDSAKQCMKPPYR